ncbi:GMC family oxidoreductase N-terminal domain-containing protein [Haliangium sp.]
MNPRYDAIVIGSGYGGGIAASRLARAGKRVCLLERGREIRPGDYPDSADEAIEDMQFHTPHGHEGRRTAMFDFHVQEEISVLVGCGLGGTSLINANVALEAVDGVWDDERWPPELRGAGNQVLARYYDLVRTTLGSTPYPQDFPTLPKLEAHRKSAEAMDLPWCRVPINVTFEDRLNWAGVAQKACINCGDCVSGCNHLAKNTTLMNYLPDAWNHGAEIFTEAAVSHIERGDDGWLVHFQALAGSGADCDDGLRTVAADIVVVAAGTLGSTEILLRSKQRGLPLSERVGRDFSGNGDVLGFSYNDDQEVNAIGFGKHTDGSVAPVGPTITSMIDNRGTADWRQGWVIEEGAIPGAMGMFLPEMFTLFAGLVGKDTDHGAWDWIKEKARAAESWLLGAYHGAVNNTQTYLGMGHDGSNGDIELTDDGIVIAWPGVGKEEIFDVVNDNMEAATAALGGTFIKDPIWTEPLGDTLISVHPLGGCAMAESAASGVVNHKGQVFSGAAGDAVHDGLYVADGSIVPLSIGVNPLLTLSALAERIMALMAEDRGWTLDVHTPSSPDQRTDPADQPAST